MTLDDLLPKFQVRVERACGGAMLGVDDLSDVLERARQEYSRYSPAQGFYDFTLTDTDRVSLLDEAGAPISVVAVFNIFLMDSVPSYPLGQGFGAPINGRGAESDWAGFTGQTSWAENRDMPSILFTQAKYRDAYWVNVSWYRNGADLVVIRPLGRSRIQGVVHYGAERPWSDIPAFDERLIIDRALVEFIDTRLILSDAGRVRIPTPHGSFEFDGGAVLLSLRNKLLENFQDQLTPRMSFLGQG